MFKRILVLGALLPTLAFGQSLSIGTAGGITYKAGTGGGSSTIPVGCSVAGGVLTCSGFTSDTDGAANGFTQTTMSFFMDTDHSTGDDIYLSTSGSPAIFELHAVRTAAGGAYNHNDLYLDSTALETTTMLRSNAANGPGTTMRNIASTSVVADAGAVALIVGSIAGPVRFFSGGEATSNESWNINSSGNIVSVGAGRNITTTGTVQSSATGIGWSVQSGANTACNTTCSTHGACVVGFNSGSSNIAVDCTDATADVCLCAGNS